MKTRIAIWLGVGITLLAAPGLTRAAVFNGSFESWNLIGWDLHNDLGDRATEPSTRTAGVARTMSSWGEDLGFSPGLTPVAGYRFLALSTRDNANFLGNDTYNTFVSQSVSLNQGEAVSGWSFFFNGDSEPLDSAWVRVLDQNGNLLANPWTQTSGSPGAGQALVLPTPNWTQWQWAAPTTGSYTLQLGMTTSGANNSASFGLFDGITIAAQIVPEPSAMVLGLLGGLALMALRHRTR